MIASTYVNQAQSTPSDSTPGKKYIGGLNFGKRYEILVEAMKEKPSPPPLTPAASNGFS